LGYIAAPEKSMPDTPLSLLQRLRQSEVNSEDWDRLVAVYDPLLRSWLGRYPLQGGDADDLVQEVLTVLVKKLPQFQHGGKQGSFRAWLRSILANKVRYFYRQRRSRPQPAGCGEEDSLLFQLEDSNSELSRRWDAEHDQYVISRLLEMIKAEFTPTTWQAFERSALQNRPAAEVGAELGMTANAVWIAHSRVMRRLREEARGLVDD
jgi:RNA polymerase sigma-70 factor (ECF subfamily)